ncbi:cation diffusion facilitator family transporter [Methylocella tundrae]|uniref:Cation diffusion facilitator family transporter n=1 Tax=Methylocella tundrae TaxID=227605 RepID=A0A4U8YWN3_METTU|nr:cation transporter [Methylocella tundrae]WPP05077.1 cation transporter [Methylocella tundrae]VFU07380.1 Cation diffusion facilitator family transporter [Methylocella tundrae]
MSESPEPIDTRAEQNLLRLSIAVTFVLGLIGVSAGLAIGSRSILFDGVYSIVDVAMTGLALIVSKLLTREGSRRFQFGYWHFEPMVAAFNGTILSLSCIYAFLDAVGLLIQGGHRLDFGPAAIYAILVSAACLVMARRMRRASEALDSDLLRIDARGFLMGGALSLALLASFLGAMALERAGYRHLAPFADPAILIAVTLCLAPIPMFSVWRALREIFLVAPPDLDADVRRILDAVTKRHGFQGYTSYVAKTGRARFIDAHIIAHASFPIGGVEALDKIREEIASEIGEGGAPLWLNVCFTADRKWT